MRITNKMMNSTSLTNINRNKEYLDKLNTQLSSKKKISRPSDDPVVAIRALKLRSNLSEITQYYEKNVSDADAWLQATQQAIESTKTIVTSMKSEFTTGATGTNTTESRKAILEELKALRDQIYDDGNADYAGRTLFTGYRTSSKLTFESDTTVAYRDITQGFNASNITSATYISGKLDTTTDVNGYATSTTTEQDVVSTDLSRIRLAYDDLDVAQVDSNGNALTSMTLTYRTSATATASVTTTGIDVSAFGDTISLTKDATTGAFSVSGGDYGLTQNEDGTYTLQNATNGQTINLTASGKIANAYTESTMDVQITSLSGDSDAAYAVGDDEIHLIPETGELILGTNVATTLSNLTNIDGVNTMEFAYDKSDWQEDDLRPEHYFDCYDATSNITYASQNQSISYDVSSNQSMRINTYASEIYTHDIGRDVDEMMSAIEDVEAAAAKVETLTALQSDSTADQDQVTQLLDAANKEYTLANDKMQKMFENGQTKFTEHLENVTKAGTNTGTRISRLELVENRLSDLKTTAQELADDNENVEITDLAIQVSEAELSYNAALLATGKIAQQTLLSYL